MINFSTYSPYKETFKSILCLDGDLPPASFFAERQLPIIAADGAANTLMAMGITPSIVIGDLDGIHPELRAKLNVLHTPDQNFSDYQKSLHYLAEQKLLPTIVCGIAGGMLDHILNNINIFMGSDSVLYTDQIIGHVLKCEQKKVYELPLNTKISLLGMPQAVIQSQGLQWELNKFESTFPGNNSCYNRTKSAQVNIEILAGAALILIYHV